MFENQASHPSKRLGITGISKITRPCQSVIIALPGFGLAQLNDEPAAYAMAPEKIDLLNLIDLMGDVLASDATGSDKRFLAISLVRTAMPRSLAGCALQSLLLTLLNAADHFGGAPLERLRASALGISGRFASEIFLLRDRIESGKRLDVLEFLELACLVRCAVAAADQGWMLQTRHEKEWLL